MEEKLLAALRARAYRGACRIEDRKALAAELGISVGKLARPALCPDGEGRILQDHVILSCCCPNE